jgi:RNA-binding protein
MAERGSAPVALAGYQRQYLKGLAHALRPVVQVGDKGVTVEVVAAVAAALRDHELIKVRLHEPDDKQTMAATLADACDATLCGLVGHTVILYKRHPKAPKIKVPVRAAKGG